MNFSYWETEHFNQVTDFTIIGAGLTGLQTAIALKEQHANALVAVIDRFAWSLGASTRNAGFACFANVSEILDDLQNHSQDEVYQLIADRYNGLRMLRDKFGDQNIGFEQKGSVEIFTKHNKEDLHKAIDSIQGINSILHHKLDLDRVFTFTSSTALPQAIGAISNPFEGQLNTGNLYRTVLRYAQLIGVQCYFGTEVTNWTKEDVFTVHTAQGFELKTQQLILCTNAFTSHLVEQDIVPARGQVIVTEKLDQLPCEGLHHFDHGYYYWRDVDQRILLGGARNKDVLAETTETFDTSHTILSELQNFLFSHITNKEVGIEHRWSGIMAMGSNNERVPILKEDNGVLVAARLGGMGVALSALIAQKITEKLGVKKGTM